MKGGIEAIVRILANVRSIVSLTVTGSLRRRILNTYLRTFVFRRYDSHARIANILGYQVKFCSYSSLLWLFKELFLAQQYHFLTARPCPYIIDCGSNIGMSVLYFKALYPDSSILAFEPDEEAFACLQANVEVNKLQCVWIVRKALSDREGLIDFYYDESHPGSLGMSTRVERMPKQKRQVEATPLSKYIDRDVDFLKIDVEGGELRILEDLRRGDRLSRVQQMIVEYHHHIVKDEDELSKILALLEGSGFGYQIEGGIGRPLQREVYQDLLVYAYRKAARPAKCI